MKCLLIHNFYGSSAPSGENKVFEEERDLLRRRGHDVHELLRYSDQIRNQGGWGELKGGLGTPWHVAAARNVRNEVEALRPDVVHVHNTFPMLSPAIFRAVGRRAPRVLSLHNYRLFCPAAIPMRQARVCTECIDQHSVRPALRHGCYRGSRTATLPLAFSVWLHRTIGTWRQEVDAFIVMTEFQRDVMSAAGLPAERVHVKPNFFPGEPQPVPWSQRGDYAVVAGRLSPEKGIDTLIRAWDAWGDRAPQLRILGDGPQRAELERLAQAAPAGRIRFLGQVPKKAAVQEVGRARLMLLPSQWFEAFPMVIQEAFAQGTPVAVSALGPLPEIARHGLCGILFPAANPQALLAQVSTSWEQPGHLEQLGRSARAEYERAYTESANHARLLEIYEMAGEAHRARYRKRDYVPET